MAIPSQSPADLRAMFGANLRKLSADYSSISDLSRKLGINRTQYNRYLAGESFPRPDVLARICSFFDVDARVLLEPVERIGDPKAPISDRFLQDFIRFGSSEIPEEFFPSGFYRFSRRSFIYHDTFVMGLVYVSRSCGNVYLRGYELRDVMRLQGLPVTAKSREFRGFAMQQEDGVAMIAGRHGGRAASFNYLSRAPSVANTLWVGHISRVVPESLGGLRATRMVYEHLPSRMSTILPAARASGFFKISTLPEPHRALFEQD